MKIKNLLRALLFITTACLVLKPSSISASSRPELRAFWADGFNPAFKTPEQIDILLKRLHNAHCNAVFAQVRKRGDAYYLSRYEPWASDDTGRFDALASLIRKAHAMNPPIAVHAWINTCAVGGGAGNSFNIVHLHPDWLSLNPKQENFDQEATKIDPGNPDAADWTFRVYLDVARHYNVDGIHFDFVRYGGREWGYNPVSVERFEKQVGSKHQVQRLEGGLPAPTDPLWKQWRRDQVSGLVRKVYAHAAKVNPKLVVSAAVITWQDGPQSEEEWYSKSAAMNRVYQDWRGWLEEGILDLACPMTYFQADPNIRYQKHWSEFIKNHQYHRAATVGVGNWFNTVPDTLELMKISREKSAEGHLPFGVMLYSYGGTNLSDNKGAKGKRAEMQYQPAFYEALSNPSKYSQKPPFPDSAQIPEMKWKSQPEKGIIKGFVLDGKYAPIDGAEVSIQQGDTRVTHSTDGTGFYAFIDVNPGSKTVHVITPSDEKAQVKANVEAGTVATENIRIGKTEFKLLKDLPSLLENKPDLHEGNEVCLENMIVLRGSDVCPKTLFVMDRKSNGIAVNLAESPSMPFQAGDVVSLTGKFEQQNGEWILGESSARLTDILPLSALEAAAPLNSETIKTVSEVTGRISEITKDGFMLEGKVKVNVLLTGLKDPDVEYTSLSMRTPKIGDEMIVTGCLSKTFNSEGSTGVLLRPFGAEDIRSVGYTSSRFGSAAQRGALAIFRRRPAAIKTPKPKVRHKITKAVKTRKSTTKKKRIHKQSE